MTAPGLPDELRALSEAATPGPWQWLDGEDEGDELQDGHGEMVATSFRENLVFDGKPLNRDGSFAAAAVNYVRALAETVAPGLDVERLAHVLEAEWDKPEPDWPSKAAAIAREYAALADTPDGKP
jgi:hypothetical protein